MINSSEIIRAMEESKSPWHEAQEYVNIKLTETKYSKREGKTALIFAACWLANNYRQLYAKHISQGGSRNSHSLEEISYVFFFVCFLLFN